MESTNGKVKTEIKKRTFEALKYPKNSKEREQLNLDRLTSEYMTSYKYVLYVYLPETPANFATTLTYNGRTKEELVEKAKDFDKFDKYEKGGKVPNTVLVSLFKSEEDFMQNNSFSELTYSDFNEADQFAKRQNQKGHIVYLFNIATKQTFVYGLKTAENTEFNYEIGGM